MIRKSSLALILGCSLIFTTLSSKMNVLADPYMGAGMPSCSYSVKFGGNYNSSWTSYLNNSIGAWNSTSTPVIISQPSSASNILYAGSYSDSWLGNYTLKWTNGVVSGFTIKVNSRTISNAATNFANFAQSTTVHEFGHSFSLDDDPTTNRSTIMSYSRNRNTMIRPQQFDIENVNAYY